MPIVTSRQHPFVRRCRLVASGRGEPGVVLLDGLHLLEDAAAAGVPIEAVMTTEERRAAVDRLGLTAPLHVAARDVLDAASPVRSPSGVVALASWAPDALPDLFADAPALLVGLVGVQDPGNVGNVIRTADAFGAAGVLLLDGSADPGSWKVLRAAMGSTFRVPIARGSAHDAIRAARVRGVRIAAAVAAGGAGPEASRPAAPVLLLVGSEGAGLPRELVETADVRLTLPMRPGIESLNAATTAAVLLWELTRPGRAAHATTGS